MHKNQRSDFFSKLSIKGITETFNKFESEFYFLFIILITTSFLFFFLTYYVIGEKWNVLDYNIFLLIRKIINPAGIKVARLVTVLGTGNFLVPAYIFIVIYLEKRNYRSLVYMTLVTAISSLLLGWLLKWVFHRIRPPDHLVIGAGGYSFPSGHALGGFIFSGIVLYLIWKIKRGYYVKWILSALVIFFGFCVGISRIYLHVHFATDVLGSLIIAIWWLSFMHILLRLLYRNNISNIEEKRDTAFFPNDYYLQN
jgi:undecaprenyl-diphosphatase